MIYPLHRRNTKKQKTKTADFFVNTLILIKLLKKAIVFSPLKTEIACPTSSGWIEPANATGINIISMRNRVFL